MTCPHCAQPGDPDLLGYCPDCWNASQRAAEAEWEAVVLGWGYDDYVDCEARRNNAGLGRVDDLPGGW